MRLMITMAVSAILITSAQAEDLVVTFVNKTGIEHKGCVAYGFRADGTKASSGIKPVPGNGSFSFNLGDCKQFKKWQFVAAIDYSDNPENLDVVLVNTGVKDVTKCTWTITGTANKKSARP